MKRVIIFYILLIGMTASLSAQLKIGYILSERIRGEYEEFKEAESQLQLEYKKVQFEFCLQKVIELGVDNIFCYSSEKTSDKYNLKNAKEKLERYQDIIESAFLQSENKYLPKLNFINNLL